MTLLRVTVLGVPLEALHYPPIRRGLTFPRRRVDLHLRAGWRAGPFFQLAIGGLPRARAIDYPGTERPVSTLPPFDFPSGQRLAS
jgi:hypothetical protein